MSLLDIRNISICSRSSAETPLVDRLSVTVNEGEILALVGESGSGKSLVAQAVLGLLSDEWQMSAERLYFDGLDLLRLDRDAHRGLLGNQLSMVFQNPTQCLDPIVRVGDQLLESLPCDAPLWKRHRVRRHALVSLLHQVGIRDHGRLMAAYPHELSTGLCQKVMIAMAIARRPRLLIADEPTTGMEPGTQSQILRLLHKLNQLNKMSILLLSHDIHAAALLADRISVVYCGQVVETGSVADIISRPMHPYTEALLASAVAEQDSAAPKSPLPELRGGMPRRDYLPIGCRLGPRCRYARRECVRMPDLTRTKERDYRCHFPLNQSKAATEDEET